MATIAAAVALFALPILCPPLATAVLCSSLAATVPGAAVVLAQVALVQVQSPN